jgi:hypothetical protein
MQVVLKCNSRQHRVRLDPNRFWGRTLCPECRGAVDPTRLRRVGRRLLILFSWDSQNNSDSNVLGLSGAAKTGSRLGSQVVPLKSPEVQQIRSRTGIENLRRDLAARIPDSRARLRLVEFASFRYPEKSEAEVYEIVIEQYEKDRR